MSWAVILTLFFDFTDTAFQHVAYTQLPTHILYSYCLALVGKDGVTGNYKKSGDLGEISDKILGYPIAEILLLQDLHSYL